MFVIVALILFAKTAPKFICDILGIKGADESIGNMFKRAGGLFGAASSGIRTARSNYTSQKERMLGKGYGKSRQVAEGLRSAIAGFGSATGRGTFMSAQGKGYKDVKNSAFQNAIKARNSRNDRVDNLYNRNVPEYIKDKDGKLIKNPEYYGIADYRRDVRREKLGIPSSEGFIKTRYDAMQNIAKIAADSKGHGVTKMNETPERYQVSLVNANGLYDDDASMMIGTTLGFKTLDMEHVRNLYALAKNGQKVTCADGTTKVQLTDAEISALGTLVQKIEKRTSYLKEAELMGTGDPAASPNVDKLTLAIRNNKSMFTAPEIMQPIIAKMQKYNVVTSDGRPVVNFEQLLDVVQGLQNPLNEKDFTTKDDYFAEVSRRADVLNSIKDSFEEVAKQQYKGAETADARAKKAQQAISNSNDKKS